jgi:hypothetical protein
VILLGVFSVYGQLLRVDRARPLVLFSLLARVSTGAYVIPLVLLIQGATGSFALAGTGAALVALAGAVSGPSVTAFDSGPSSRARFRALVQTR